MKKILILFAIMILICGCSKEVKDNKRVKKEPKSDIKVPIVEKYQDENNTPIGLYLQDGYVLNLVKDYKTDIKVAKDIVVFQIFPSQEEQIILNKDFGTSFFEKWSSIPNYQNLKIGFNMKYTLDNGEQINHTILDPSTTIKEGNEIIFTYLYDDYLNRYATHYSHIEENEYNNESLFTSIKIFSNFTESLASKISFTVFTYDNPEDIDENLEYRGNSSYTVEICDTDKTCD